MVEPSFPVSVPTRSTHCSLLQLRQAAGMWVSRLSAEVFLARQTPQSPRILSALSPWPGEAHQGRPPCTEPLDATRPTGSQLCGSTGSAAAVPWSLHLCSSEQAPPEGQVSAKL